MCGALPHRNKFETHFILAKFLLSYLASGKNAPFISDKGKSGVQPNIAFGKWWFVPNLTHTVSVAWPGEILHVGWEGKTRQMNIWFLCECLYFSGKAVITVRKRQPFFLLYAGKTGCLFYASCLLWRKSGRKQQLYKCDLQWHVARCLELCQ